MYAVPGGLIGVGTKIDPTLCRADRMVGQVLGSVGGLPDIFTELEVSYYLLRRLLGVRVEGDKKGAKVSKLSKNEMLMVNIGSLSTGGRVIAVKADLAKIGLTTPGKSITATFLVSPLGYFQVLNIIKFYLTHGHTSVLQCDLISFEICR